MMEKISEQFYLIILIGMKLIGYFTCVSGIIMVFNSSA